MTPPRLALEDAPTTDAHSSSRNMNRGFRFWEPVPPTTEMSDLFATSLLALPKKPGRGVLMRCSAGLKDGSAVMVLADAARPNALRMLGVESDTSIGDQAQAVVGGGPVTVLAIPHITWKRPGAGRPWRTTVTVLSALVASALVLMLDLPLGIAAAVPVAAVVGSLMWLLMRRSIQTQIDPVGGSQLSVGSVVEHALSRVTCTSSEPSLTSAQGDKADPSGV